MQPSENCANFIKSFEAFRAQSYLPTPDDKPTIGFGTTGPDIRLGMTWTRAQAEERFRRDLAAFGAKVAALVKPTTAQCEYDAMVSLAYNIGVSAFSRSTVLRKHNAGDKRSAAAAFLMWNKQRGKVLAGLTRRREAEKSMYEAR